jgi:hypothetical protein
MLSTSVLAREALAGPHPVYTRVEVWLDGVEQLHSLPIIGGNVRASLQSRVTRNLDLTVGPEWFPESADDLLAPFGTELRVFRGVALGGVTNHPSLVWPVFRGPIDTIRWETGGACTIAAFDLAGDVASSHFLAPLSVSAGDRLHTRYREFVSEARDDAEFDTFTLPDRVLPSLTWDVDRGKALDDLAGTAGGFWYALADGTFTLREVPWVYSDGVVDLDLGPDNPLLRSAGIAYSREDVYNMIVARAERTDGSAPARYVTRVTDPASPIRFDGPYGRRVLHHSVQGAGNAAGLQLAAETLKQRSQALAETWTATITAYPPLELGDLLHLDVEGPTGKRRRGKQVVAGFTMPLTGDGDMPLELRALMPRGEAVL